MLQSLIYTAAVGACIGSWVAFYRKHDTQTARLISIGAILYLLVFGFVVWWKMNEGLKPDASLLTAAIMGLSIAIHMEKRKPEQRPVEVRGKER